MNKKDYVKEILLMNNSNNSKYNISQIMKILNKKQIKYNHNLYN